MPVRITGFYYSGIGQAEGELGVCYRCTMRGGDLVVHEGHPPAGFFDWLPLPRGLSAKHRQQVNGALHHAGGPPVMERETGGLGTWLGRLTGRSNPNVDAASWEVSVQLDLSAEGSDVEWAISGLTNERPRP